MARRKNSTKPDPNIPGNEPHAMQMRISLEQRKNLDTALNIYRLKNHDTTIQELILEALEAYYGPQDVRISE